MTIPWFVIYAPLVVLLIVSGALAWGRRDG